MSKKGKGIQGAVGTFIKQYQRKAQKHWDPNDRQYDRKNERIVKSIDPWRLNDIMYDDNLPGLSKDIEDCWFEGKSIDGVRFSLNDPVSVAKGPHSGKSGAVIRLLTLHQDPVYLVELGDGTGDIRISQSQLEQFVY